MQPELQKWRSMPAQQKNYVERDKNRDDQFQRKHAALVELRDHELVQFAGRLQFLADQRLVIVHADLGGNQPVDARIVCVADEFYSVFRPLRQIHNVEAEAIQAAGTAREAPAGKKTFAACQRAVYVRKEVGEHFIVVAKFQQLRVGVFEQVDDCGGRVGFVINERGGPTDHDQVCRIVRKSATKNLVTLGSGQRSEFAAHKLRDRIAILLEQLLSGWRASVFVICGLNVDYEIVFIKPFRRGPDQRGLKAFEASAQQILGGFFNFGRIHPAIRIGA